LPLTLALVTLIVTLVLPRRFTASVAFTPTAAGGQLSSLAGVAAEFGVNIPTNGDDAESPQFYADLVGAQSFLERLVAEPYRIMVGSDSVVVRMDTLFGISEKTPEATVARTAERLDDRLNATVSPATGVVRVTVRLRLAPLAEAVIRRTLAQIQEFNATTHQTRARWERQFIEDRMRSAAGELEEAESQLGEFLIRNRDYSKSPALQFQADKLQRQVALRQDVLTTLARSLEQAKIDEVKAEPVLTIVEPPVVSPLPDRRRLALKGLLAIFGGLALATIIVVGSEYYGVMLRGDLSAAGELQALTHATRDEIRGLIAPILRRDSHPPDGE